MKAPQFITGPCGCLQRCILVGFCLFSHLLNVAADVIAHFPDNNSISFLSMPSTFGGTLPKNGFTGPLAIASPFDACKSIAQAPGEGFIALIERYNCDFDQKVLNAQKSGFVAAIVSNKGSNGIFPMSGSVYSQSVFIPSVFVGADAGLQLTRMNYTTGVQITLTRYISLPWGYYFYPFITVIATCLIFSCFYGIAKFVRDRRRLRRVRLSREHLKQLPVIKFKKGVHHYETCAICLDDYEENSKLRILPCNHAFHCKCIDPWLTNNRRTCPICKQKVVPPGVHDSDSETEEGPDENTPLLNSRGGGRDDSPTGSMHGAVGGIPTPLDVNMTSALPIGESYDSGIDNVGSIRHMDERNHNHRVTADATTTDNAEEEGDVAVNA